MPRECVIDTVILQKANATITREPRPAALFRRRLALLTEIANGTRQLLISQRLLTEYEQRIPSPRNDFIRAFFELVQQPDRVIWNWKRPWSGNDRATMRRCRYPGEDEHVLRTAIRDRQSVIFSEENRMCRADVCVFRNFRVHISALP
jgi:hypothetical protein